MALEQERGISITAAALEFELEGRRMTLLDTPGRKDFSEDTYRALIAADSVVMVIDAANGVEDQTRKLFEVCRRHRLPILTFINKFDRPSKDPLELLDDLERTLGIHAAPVNWPIGSAERFRGVYDLERKTLLMYEREAQGQHRAPVDLSSLDDPDARALVGEEAYAHFRESLDIIRAAGTRFDLAEYLVGRQTPVFFGSGVNNFGVQLLLDGFLKHSPAPKSRVMGGIEIAPENPEFSGFIFKIQANMDPKHRDRIAFIRVCSGKFERDMTVHHSRTEKKVRLSSSHKLFGNERETVDEAFPGDVIGLVGHDSFGIGDTLTTDPKIAYKEIPRFTPEAFSYLHNPNTGKYKQFRQGLDQLLQEGVIQALYLRNSSIKTPLLAAVGPLQFEVVQFRLESEYGAESRLEAAPWNVVRWLPTDITEDALDALTLPTGARLAYDLGKNPVVLFQNEWSANYFGETNKNYPLSAVPVQTARE